MKTPLETLRAWLLQHQAEAIYIPISDPHANEYIPEYWQYLKYLSGFTGSAAEVVVTPEEALLWTDSRYWLQGETELRSTGFSLMRDGEAGVPTPAAWCKARGIRTLFVPDEMVAVTWQDNGLGALGNSVKVRGFSTAELFAAVWTARPALPAAPIFVQSLAWAGVSAEEKLKSLREEISGSEQSAPFTLFGELSDVAWLLNLRGGDIAYNPVFLAWLVYEKGKDQFVLFTHTETLTPAARQQLSAAGVALRAYADILPYCRERGQAFGAKNAPLFLAPYLIKDAFVPNIEARRAIKNAAEQAGFREAMERDGVALVKFLRWLDEEMEKGAKLTEVSIDEKLTALRARQAGFEQLSFATIAGFAAHGAIVHYEATKETAWKLERRGLLLLDSGAQYDCGTTDITRTLALGETSAEEKLVYTLVLKGHLALQRQHFPKNTTGIQLDLAARQYMWNMHYDFGHGTGHGVGSHLCVHEGPHQIRKNPRSCTAIPFQAGMTITDEPGIYVEGRFGVRIENTLLVQPVDKTPYGEFLHFEPLTLCPYDLRPVCLGMLTKEEREQINGYHETVLSRLLPRLTDEADREWLIGHTKPI